MLEAKLTGIETTDKDCLKIAAKEELKTARAHRRESNRARKDRDWAIHCMLHRGEDRQATAVDAIDRMDYHRAKASVARIDTDICNIKADIRGKAL